MDDEARGKRDGQIRREYDEQLNYAAYRERCRAHMTRDVPGRFPGMVGVATLPPARAAAVCNMIDAEDYRLADLDWRAELMEEIITPDVDYIMRGYFRSEYMPLWGRFFKNVPGKEPPGPLKASSFYWHCDAGPSCHLKMLIYLNPSEEHGGGTAFLSEEQTNYLKRVEYIFSPIAERLKDVRHLFTDPKIKYEETRYKTVPGDAVIFAPFSVCHKGLWPTAAPRYLFQVCFVPSEVPWQFACLRHPILGQSNAWPRMPLGR